uniref:Fatty acid hydroxylase domain-containing protein n=1 Tax=Heterosigma akashiwo TaxID=2829 RepID=A0A7S3YMJ6_HETAK
MCAPTQAHHGLENVAPPTTPNGKTVESDSEKKLQAADFGPENYRSSAEFNRKVMFFRVLAVSAIFTVYWNYSYLDSKVAEFWHFLRVQWWFKHDSFEPLLASTAFVFYINVYRMVDSLNSPKILRYRIQKNQDMKPWKKSRERMYNEMMWYVGPLLVFDYLLPRRSLPEEPPTLLQIILSLVATVNLYDIFFFLCHTTVHKVPYLYRKVHAVHHTHPAVRACDAVRHTAADGGADVACSILALNLYGAHPLARSLHNVVLTYLLTELHAGYDAPWMLHRLAPAGLLGGPPRHDHHHKYGHLYMQKFGTYLDWLCGFVPRRGVKKAPAGNKAAAE